MPGARRARGLACKIKQSTRASSPRSRRKSPGIPRAMVLRFIPCSPRRANSSCRRRPWIKRRLAARSGARSLRGLGTSNGCQDHTASPSAPVYAKGFDRRLSQSAEALAKADQRRPSARRSSLTGFIPPCDSVRAPGAAASTASRLASVTIASRPSVRRDGGGYRFDLGKSRSGIFLQMGLDRQIGDLPVGRSFTDWIAGCAVVARTVVLWAFRARSPV